MSSENYAPKSVLVRTQDYTQHISIGMGIIDHGSYFDNEMQKNRYITKFIEQTKIAIESKVCKVKDDFVFPDDYAYKIDKIWNGNTFYGIKQEPFRRKFLYEYPKEEYGYQEVIPLPKFKNMTPVNKLSDDTMLIQLREDWDLKHALEGSSYVALINNGGFMHQMSDGGMPMFSEEDMQSSTLRTFYYSRPVFHSLMNDFEHFFNDAWNHISIEFQKIIDASAIGLGMEDLEETAGNSFVQETD